MSDLDLKSEIQVADDFFPIFIQKDVAQKLLYGNCKWEYHTTITFNDDNKSTLARQNWARHGLFTDTEAFSAVLDIENNEDVVEMLKHVKFYANKHFGIKIQKFIRVMFTYLPPNPDFDKNYNLFPHVDHYGFEHHNILYYINDNDAETTFYNQKFVDKESIDYTKNEIIYKVKPKQGRATYFNGHIFHSGNVSKHSKRLTLNINFIKE